MNLVKAKPDKTDTAPANTRIPVLLRKARVAKKLTQADVAKLLDVAKGTVGGWESGAHGIRPTKQRDVARVYGVGFAELTP